MKHFPPLDNWFHIRCNANPSLECIRFDLCIKNLNSDEFDNLVSELALLIARLRLRPPEYTEWLQYWQNATLIPPNWLKRFRHRFWKSFVSSKRSNIEQGRIEFDDIALQGYIGELMLYVVQHQLYDQQIDMVPRKPKPYSKDSGIDCLELGGINGDNTSYHYIVWECKATTENTPGSHPSKIYNQHLYETPKSFGELVDSLSDHHRDNDSLAVFIDEMIDDFYASSPSARKRYGGCVTFSSTDFAGQEAFSEFKRKFAGQLADDNQCRQVRLCSVGDLECITQQVRNKIWNKLLP